MVYIEWGWTRGPSSWYLFDADVRQISRDVLPDTTVIMRINANAVAENQSAKAQNCSTGSVTLKIRKSAWIMLDMLDLHPCVSSLVLMMMVASMMKDVLAVIAVVIIMVTVLTLLPPLRASCRHNKTCKNRKNRCSRMVLVLALICLIVLRQLHHDPNNKGLERHCLRPEVSRTLLGWSHWCIFGVSESKHQDWKWLEQNQLRCSWIFSGCWVFFFTSVVAFNCNDSKRKSWQGLFSFCADSPESCGVVWYLEPFKKSSDPFLSSICCMLCWPLYRCVHICTCNDFAMYLSRIYTYGPYGGVSMSHGNQYEVAKAHLRRKRCVTGTVLQTAPCQKARSISNQQNFEGLLLDVMTYCVFTCDICMNDFFEAWNHETITALGSVEWGWLLFKRHVSIDSIYRF